MIPCTIHPNNKHKSFPRTNLEYFTLFLSPPQEGNRSSGCDSDCGACASEPTQRQCATERSSQFTVRASPLGPRAPHSRNGSIIPSRRHPSIPVPHKPHLLLLILRLQQLLLPWFATLRHSPSPVQPNSHHQHHIVPLIPHHSG